MRRMAIEYTRSDERGVLDQLSTGIWKQVNMLYIVEGKTFGGHYHKQRTELFYVISGRVQLNDKEILFPGDAVLIEPGDMHTFLGLQSSVIIELLSEPFNEGDTWRG